MTEIYYKENNGFAPFIKKMEGKKAAVVYDENTKLFAKELIEVLDSMLSGLCEVYFPERELVPDEHAYETVIQKCEDCDYILAVGSGSLNDVCKYAGTKLGIPSGVLATAASMDGYLSKGSALMEKGMKVTETVNMPEDVLVDTAILAKAPVLMTAAGFGDIVGKYTCLADWNLSHILNGEEIHEEAYKRMQTARDELIDSFEQLKSYSLPAVEKLMAALLEAGTSMAICGNSRPASGSEHHQSHFLEMDFVKRGEHIPPHGVKVAIGTLVSLTMYQDLKKKILAGESGFSKDQCEKLLRLIDTLPSVDTVKKMLIDMGCPVRFSEIGVRPETMREMLLNAYKVRDRYTILTLYAEKNWMNEIIPELTEKFY